MSQSRVIYTQRASKNLNEIQAYIARDSVPNSIAVAQRILSHIDSLAESIGQHRVVGWSRSHQTPVRRMIEYPYLIYYTTVASEGVHYILAIEHGARKRRLRFECTGSIVTRTPWRTASIPARGHPI